MSLILVVIIAVLIGFGLGRFSKIDKEQQELERVRSLSNKNLDMFRLMNKWVQNKSQKKEISEYLIEKKINSVAIYGMNYIGKTLYKDLENSSIKVEYSIDRNAGCMYAECELKTLDEELAVVDAIIVTPLTGVDEIREQILKRINCKIISIEEIVYSL